MLAQSRGLYAIVDPEAAGGRGVEELARAILRGGCAALQLRDKRRELDDRVRAELAVRIGDLAREAGVPFFVDDRVDVALVSGAAGVHLGQRDLRIGDARRVAPRLIVGVSTHDEAQLREAIDAGADYVGLGPVFGTRSKARPDPVVGLAALADAARASSVPVVAIGGIDLERAESVRASGAAMGAVIAALARADDVERAARALHRALGGA